tara:strand:+ start:842 stop:1186 length:345 start_codon:yes stop_codon:yes gene_type:complete
MKDKQVDAMPSGLSKELLFQTLLNQQKLLTEQCLEGEECRSRNDRQTYFRIARELVEAQFVLADQELTRRLWQEVSDLNLEMGRIINLLYRCSSHEDESEMVEVDDAFMQLKLS